jgi:hypothetical protein
VKRIGLWLCAAVCSVSLAQPSSFAQASSAANSPAPSAEAQALMAQSKAVAEALVKKDVATLKNLLADDVREVWSDGHLYGKDELFGAAQEGMIQEFSPYDMRVLSIDDSSAIVTYDAIIHAPEGDTDLAPRYQRFSDLWVKQSGGWKLKFQQATPLRSID